MLPFKVISQSPFTAISLTEAKSQCRLMASDDIDDDYVNGLILAAADASQEYLHWMVSEAVVKQYSYDGGMMQLYGMYVTTITIVTAINSIGETITLTTDEYSYNDVTEEVYVDPSLYSNINITYNCGAAPEDLPACVKQGMLMCISTMYNNREDFITGLTVAKMPLTSQKLLSLRRFYVS